MRIVLSLIALVGVSGCIAIGPKGPTALAEGADGAMWTVRPTAEVAACLAADPHAGSAGVRYRADAVDDDKVVYRTRVSVFGTRDSQSHDYAVNCL